MRAFWCDRCGSLVFFENFQCLKCDSRLGFAPELLDVVTLDQAGTENKWRAVGREKVYRRCANDLSHAVCNWLVAEEDGGEFCVSCRTNEVIPDLSLAGNLERWTRVEAAKRRAIYNLIGLRLLPERAAGLRFRFLSGDDVMTGHAEGLITLNIAEADDAERERRRVNLREPFRTLMGHFRHEIGHFYWEELIGKQQSADFRNYDALRQFRELFGDERVDYGEALNNYYAAGPPADWQLRFVSAYAAAHPWEDWAETWAHYLHMLDTIETAGSFGVSLRPRGHPDAKAMAAEPAKVRIENAATPFDKILEHWFPLTYALNTLNRGMGLPDLYPFVLSDAIVEKLRFVHEVVRAARD